MLKNLITAVYVTPTDSALNEIGKNLKDDDDSLLRTIINGTNGIGQGRLFEMWRPIKLSIDLSFIQKGEMVTIGDAYYRKVNFTPKQVEVAWEKL